MMFTTIFYIVSIVLLLTKPATATSSTTTTTTAPEIIVETCETTNNITHFDWDDLMNDISLKPFLNYNFSVDQTALSLVIDVDLEYLGWSYADDHTSGYGTTYVLDFESYDAESDAINEPGSCQNRLSSTYANNTFINWFDYSDTPSVAGHLSAQPYTAYPPAGDLWSLAMNNATCTPINYHGVFTWSDLRACSNFAGNQEYIKLSQNDDWLNLTGVFYINIVSPLSKSSDLGFYRAYQSLSAPFVIAVKKQINLISSVGINLFVMSVIAVYKEDLESDWRMIVLTESADFLMLDNPNLIQSPTLNPNTISFQVQDNSTNDGCLTDGGFLCYQLWEIYADNVTCPPTNFTGTYGIQFDAICNNGSALYNNQSALCDSYLDTYGNTTTLSFDLEWLDEVCDAEIFIVQFTGDMKFYTNLTFDQEIVAPAQLNKGDTAYLEININTPPLTYDIFDISIANVWVCTTSPDNEPLSVNNQITGADGCLSTGSIIDAGFPRHIIQSGVENDLTESGDVTIISQNNATIRFSFIIDSGIERVNLYVHAMVMLDLAATNTSGARRRLLQEDTAPATTAQVRHFSGAAGVIAVPLEVDDDINNDDILDDIHVVEDGEEFPEWFIIILVVVAVCLCCFGILIFGYCRRKKNKKKKDEANVDIESISIEKK